MIATSRFIGLAFLFAVLGVLAVLLDWLVVFGLIALGVRSEFAQALLFLVSGVLGPCWAGYVTYAFMKKSRGETGARVKWPAIVGYGLVILAVAGIYGPLTLIGYCYRGVRM